LTIALAVFVGFGCASSGGVSDVPEGGPDEAVGDSAAPSTTPPDEAEPTEEPLLNRLKWSTATEVDNFGFDVYRGATEEGPFERVTEQPIPGGGTVDEPSYYVFEDTNIDPTKDYYYYVESIAMDGTREVFSPIIKAKAKKPL
jgi:hypothetical protein